MTFLGDNFDAVLSDVFKIGTSCTFLTQNARVNATFIANAK